jgi:hypothetical protein
MLVITAERRTGAQRVKFERPLDVRVMSLEGTWCWESRLIDLSETGARIEFTSPAADLTEFFLVLTTFGPPVFRRCKREWINGVLMGVSFSRDATGVSHLWPFQGRSEAGSRGVGSLIAPRSTQLKTRNRRRIIRGGTNKAIK